MSAWHTELHSKYSPPLKIVNVPQNYRIYADLKVLALDIMVSELVLHLANMEGLKKRLVNMYDFNLY